MHTTPPIVHYFARFSQKRWMFQNKYLYLQHYFIMCSLWAIMHSYHQLQIS